MHFQNAWQTKHPEEFVKRIYLAIPAGTDADDPAKDAALMAQIGAKQIGWNDDNSVVMYTLINAATGTRFYFNWNPGSGNRPTYWSLEII